MDNRFWRYAAVVAAFLMWGTNGLFVRSINASAPTFLFANAVFGVVALTPLLLLTGRYRELASIRTMSITILVGFLSTITGLLYYVALQLTTITNTLLAHYTMPVWVVALAPLVLAERRRRGVLLALPLALAGLVMILPFDDLALGNRHLAGIMVAVVSAVFYASSMMGVRLLGGKFSAITIAVTGFAASIFAVGPYVLSQPAEVQTIVSNGPILIIKGIFTAALPWLLYVSSLKTIEAQRVSIIGYLEPLTSIVLAALFLSEVPGPLTLVGGLCILGAGYWVIRQGGETSDVAVPEAEPL